MKREAAIICFETVMQCFEFVACAKLTCNPIGDGWVGMALHHSSDSSKRKRDTATELCIHTPLFINFTHPDGKERFWGPDRSVLNDVRVTLCSPDFVQKRLRGNRHHECSFKDRTDWFSPKHPDWRWLLNSYLELWCTKMKNEKNNRQTLLLKKNQEKFWKKTEFIW